MKIYVVIKETEDQFTNSDEDEMFFVETEIIGAFMDELDAKVECRHLTNTNTSADVTFRHIETELN